MSKAFSLPMILFAGLVLSSTPSHAGATLKEGHAADKKLSVVADRKGVNRKAV